LALVGAFWSRVSLEAENTILRHQLNVLRRLSPKRPTFGMLDRLIFAGLYRLAPKVPGALAIVKPETVIKWHRAGFKSYWRWKSRRRGGRPTLATEIRKLIREMSIANPLWGAPRIHGELLKLGVDIGQASVAKYMVRRRDPPSLRSIGIRDRPTSPRSPWQNGYAERLIGSIRRECLDHVIVFSERHLRHLLLCYMKYYNGARTHLSLEKDAPISRAVDRTGHILCRPILSGLHHQYGRI
jgi:hypothetical protein